MLRTAADPTSERVRLLANAALVAAWLHLFGPVLSWLGVIVTRSDFRLNQIVLVGALALLAGEVRGGGLRPNLSAPLRRHLPAVAMLVAGAVGFLLTERYLAVNILSAVMFGMSAYGLAGLWMSPVRWRRGLPVAVLMIAALPFDSHLEVFLGYPLRALTARIVADGLGAMGWTAQTADTILAFEGRFAQVDLPCSGVRSLWTGVMFLLAATWIERRAIGPRWLGVAVLAGCLLVGANVARIGALVLVGQALASPRAAEIMHVPLGVLAFTLVCCAGLWLLRRLPATIDDAPDESEPSERPWVAGTRQLGSRAAHTPGLAAGLICVLLPMSVLYAARPETGHAAPAREWSFPGVSVEIVPLSAAEVDWLSEDGADSVSRVNFRDGDLAGSMILVTSRTWRAHHLPERCFEVHGHEVSGASTQMIHPGFPVRVVSLNSRDSTRTKSASVTNGGNAVYWFQSAGMVTDDYTRRIWSDLSGRSTWVLVSLLFDRTVDPADPAVRDLFVDLRDAIATQLEVSHLEGGRS